MSSEQAPHLFADLPSRLVEELLGQATSAGRTLLAAFRGVREKRDVLRKQMLDNGMVAHESSLGYPPQPTTCGTDGSYAIERLLTADLAAAAAVAVEGLVPPKEVRHWPEPRHSTFVALEPHCAETATVLRAVMIGHELLLASDAPHDVVMIDGTLTLPLIYFNQALNPPPEAAKLACRAKFLSEIERFLEAYRTLLRPTRSDKDSIALPKYSTRREIGVAMGWPGEYDDRSLLTLVLGAGELTQERRLEPPTQPWHLNVPSNLANGSALKALADEVCRALTDFRVVYYKPHVWLPALRIEVAPETAANKHRLATVLQGLKHQCATPSMLEPYPLYLADRMVKALARAVPTFRHVATQSVSEQYEGDIADVFFAMHGYRSETGGRTHG